MPQLSSATTTNRLLARLAKPTVHDHALRIGVRAEALLAQHQRTGRHRITVSEGSRSDAFVALEGPAAAAVEMGHLDHGRYVEGIHVLRDAAGL